MDRKRPASSTRSICATVSTEPGGPRGWEPVPSQVSPAGGSGKEPHSYGNFCLRTGEKQRSLQLPGGEGPEEEGGSPAAPPPSRDPRPPSRDPRPRLWALPSALPGCEAESGHSGRPDVCRGGPFLDALVRWFKKTTDMHSLYSLPFLHVMHRTSETLQHVAPADLGELRPPSPPPWIPEAAPHPTFPPSQEGNASYPPHAPSGPRLVERGAGPPGGGYAKPTHSFHRPTSSHTSTSSLLHASPSPWKRTHKPSISPFCLVLGPVQAKETRSQRQAPAADPTGFSAPAPPPNSSMH